VELQVLSIARKIPKYYGPLINRWLSSASAPKLAKSYGKAKAINDAALVVSPTMPPPVAIMTTYCFPSRP
jgi:hypothetical protein